MCVCVCVCVCVCACVCWFVFQGKLVYANQGKPSDYMLLNKTLDLRGTIAITRYGGAGRADKVSSGCHCWCSLVRWWDFGYQLDQWLTTTW